MNSTIINKIDALNQSTMLNDSNLLNRINNINTSSNIESLGFNTTIKLKSYFDTLYYSASNPSNYITDGNTNWDNSYGFITNNTMNRSILWSYITDKPTFNNGTSNLTTTDTNNLYYNKTVIDSMNSTTINKIDALNQSTSLNDTNLLNRINNINTSSNIESLGFNTTIKLKSYFDTLYYSASNPSNYITDGNTNWDNSYGFITNLTMNKSILWSYITDKPTFNNGTSNLTLSQVATAIQNTSIAHLGINVTNKICTWNATTSLIDCGYTDQTTSISLDPYYKNLTNFTINNVDNKICIYNSTLDKIECKYTDQTGGVGSSTIDFPNFNPDLNKFTTIEQEFISCTTGAFGNFLGSTTSSGAVLTSTTSSNGRYGLCALRDSTTAGGRYSIGTTERLFVLSGNETAQFIFKKSGIRNTTQARMGFLDSFLTTEPAEGCYFYIGTFNTNSSNQLRGKCRNADIETNTSTFYNLSTSLFYYAKISTNTNATNVYFELRASNLTKDLLWSNNITTNIPRDTNDEVGFGVMTTESTTDSAADILIMDYMSLQINRTLNR